MSVGIGKIAGIASPEHVFGRLDGSGSGCERGGEHVVGLLLRARIVGDRNRREPGGPVRHARVAREVFAAEQGKGESVALKKYHFGLARRGGLPAKRLVEGAGPRDIGDSERDEGDARIHQAASSVTPAISRPRSCSLVCAAWRSPVTWPPHMARMRSDRFMISSSSTETRRMPTPWSRRAIKRR